MDKNILGIIKDIHDRKKNRDPNFATYKELLFEVRRILNELHESGLIEVGNTLNDKYIRLIK